VGALTLVSLVSFMGTLPSLNVAAARPGTIRGRVEVRRTLGIIERRPLVAELSTPESVTAHEAADRNRSVVYLESAPRGAFEQSEPGRALMDQRNETFVPHVLAITIGTIVDFPNSDRIYHNVFSLSKTKRFD